MSNDTPTPPDPDSNQPGPSPSGGAANPPPEAQPPSGPPTPPPPPAAGSVPPTAPPPGLAPSGGQPGYAQQGGAQPQAFSVTKAFTFGWKKFQENLGPWLIATIVAFIVMVVATGIYTLLASFASTGTTITSNPLTGQVEISGGGVAGWFLVVGPLWYAVIVFIQVVIGAQFVRAALETARKGKIEFEVFTRTEHLGSVIGAAIILAVAYFILGLIGIVPILGSIILFIGGLALWFFSHFYAYFILDRGASAMEGIKQSAAFVNSNIATVIVLFLASFVALVIGAILCGIGLLVAIPVVAMAQAYTYRYLTGEDVSA